MISYPTSAHAGSSTRAVLVGVVRHALPTVVEATLIPSALFFVGYLTIGKMGAFALALAWAYGALVRHIRCRERVPGLLILALIGLTVRTALAMATGSTFLYFAQPIVGTTLVAVFFLATALTARPFVGRLAGDFYPLTPQIAALSPVKRLFRNLTVFWAAINLTNAAVGIGMLLTLPTGVFIPTKTAVSLTITAFGVFITVISSLRVVRTEGLTMPGRAACSGVYHEPVVRPWPAAVGS
jgi:hypothetical protein